MRTRTRWQRGGGAPSRRSIWLEADRSKVVLTIHCDPLVQVLAVRQHDGHAQVPASQRGLGMFQQLVLVRPLGDVLLGLKRPGGAVSTVSVTHTHTKGEDKHSGK